VRPALDEIHTILDRQHQIKNPRARLHHHFVINQVESTDRLLTLLTWFAGGGGRHLPVRRHARLANIMLVTVTERTSEIASVGDRGAAQRHPRAVLIESVPSPASVACSA